MNLRQTKSETQFEVTNRTYLHVEISINNDYDGQGSGTL